MEESNSGTNCSLKLEAKITLESHRLRCRWEDVIIINLQNWDMCKNVDDFQLAWDSIQGAVVKQVRNLWFS